MSKSTCSFAECQRKHYARGLCNSHYQQQYKRGKNLSDVQERFHGTPEERFYHYAGITESCWHWNGPIDDYGYGVLYAKGVDSRRAHRFGYIMLKGPIPSDLVLDHLCRNRSCVNPNHLEPVIQRENVLRGESPSAKNARKTHCKRNHEFTPENTIVRKSGRECRECLYLRRRGLT